MLKTYFCELVLGFMLNLDQTTAVQFSGLSRLIIIKKMLNFVVWLLVTLSFREGAWPKYTQMPIKSKKNLKTLRNTVKTCVR